MLQRTVLVALLVSGAISTARAEATGKTPGIDAPSPSAPGVVDFLFSHHFQVVSSAHKVLASPTFDLEVGILPRLALGTDYATSTDVGPRINEFQPYLKLAALTQDGSGLFDLTAIASFNTSASSVDGALVLSRSLGPVTVLLSPRIFSNGYDSGGFAFAGGVGLRVALMPKRFFLVGDVNDVLAAKNLSAVRTPVSRVGWSAGLAFVIPYSPHTVSLYVTNLNTLTLEGESRGTNALRVGFEFDVPLHLDRFAELFRSTPAAPASPGPRSTASSAPGAAVRVVQVKIQNFDFQPSTLTVAPGTTVEWTNGDQVLHTATADDRSWDSGNIPPGGHWRRRFDKPGRYPYFCAVHPFMKATVVVKAP